MVGYTAEIGAQLYRRLNSKERKSGHERREKDSLPVWSGVICIVLDTQRQQATASVTVAAYRPMGEQVRRIAAIVTYHDFLQRESHSTASTYRVVVVGGPNVSYTHTSDASPDRV